MRPISIIFTLLSLLLCGGAAAQQRAQVKPAHIGYLFPAGGQQGTTFQVKVGGENIYGATEAVISGTGVTVRVTDAVDPDADMDIFKKNAKKRMKGAAISEVVTVKVTITPDAAPGTRDLFLLAPGGASNKLSFQVGELKEVSENEPNNDKKLPDRLPVLPVTINGQITPGDIDYFKFTAKQGQHLVAEVSARVLIPYIADAVPGWFQPIVSLLNAQGAEVTRADSFRFSQDPVLFYDVPADGEYLLAIHDSIYRGRADFVYRIRLGELPYITDIYPLGTTRSHQPLAVQVTGTNLPGDSATVSVDRAEPGHRAIFFNRGGVTSNTLRFSVGDMPEIFAEEKETSLQKPLFVTTPVVVNGRIRAPAKADYFSFLGYQGQTICIEVMARRLGSPLDSFLVLLDAKGEKVAENDDVKDKGEGIITHQADSAITCVLPNDGIYTVKLYDTQARGGRAYAYRLRISPPMPDFELRAGPAAVLVARGGSAPMSIYAIRKEGFTGEIKIGFDGAASGLSLNGAVIPAGMDKVRLTVSAAPDAPASARIVHLSGRALVGDVEIVRPALPSEDLMQAFIYQHLAPFAEQQVVVAAKAAPFTVSPQLPVSGVLELPLGKEISFPVTVTRGPNYDGPVRLQLEDAPKGITVRNAFIPAGKDRALVTLRTESKTEPKLCENLIFSGIMPVEVEATQEEIARAEAFAAKNAKKTAAEKTETTGTPEPAGKKGKFAEKAIEIAAAAAAARKAPEGQKKPVTITHRLIVTIPAIPFRIVEKPDVKPAVTPPAAAKPGKPAKPPTTATKPAVPAKP